MQRNVFERLPIDGFGLGGFSQCTALEVAYESPNLHNNRAGGNVRAFVGSAEGSLGLYECRMQSSNSNIT
jgi:hypothetical protein